MKIDCIMQKSHKMQGLFKQVFQGFVVTGTRVHEGVVDIVPSESEVSQLNKGSQMFSGFFLLHLFQMQDVLDLKCNSMKGYTFRLEGPQLTSSSGNFSTSTN